MTLDKLEILLTQVQKPARYVGGEYGAVHKTATPEVLRYALCFPDLYEVGMSHLGLKILYAHANRRNDVWCERVFAPDVDMERLMREMGVPLYGLESLDAIGGFDLIGFTLQYEMSYTAILNMLDLAGLKIRAADRSEPFPLVIAGGPCASNPEPIADFVDAFVLGEGEEISDEIFDLCNTAKAQGWEKQRILLALSKIQGIYVPSFYQIKYREDGTIKTITPVNPNVPAVVKKRIIEDFDHVFSPECFVVPFLDIVHDRAVVELFRGCIRGCRFCQAGFIYRPVREKTAQRVAKDALCLLEQTGYEEVGLSSLSTSDFSGLSELLDVMLKETQDKNINISLPSLRIDGFSDELLQKISKVKKSGLTFAPEAGTQRLRDVINKNITDENILETCRTAFSGGYTAVKLYFMMGLPTETDDDIIGIAHTAQRVVDLFYSMPERPKGKTVTVNISVACFVPKPFTPFQFDAQNTKELLEKKQKLLLSSVRSKKISVSYHDAETSRLEAMLARGDRRLGRVIEGAWKRGSRLDGWDEHFKPSFWHDSLRDEGLDIGFYVHRTRSYEEVFPWDHLDYGVTKEYLVSEHRRAVNAVTTPDCRNACFGCGADRLMGGVCPCR